MSKRLIKTISGEDGIHKVKVYFDSDYSEYVCQLFKDTKHIKNADYFTDNRQDAFGTAHAMLEHKKLKSNPKKSSSGDDIAAQELFWFITNDEKLYRQMAEPIFKNLSLKKLKNTYDHTKALKLWGYLADAGTKLYNKEHGSGKLSLQGFDVATRMLVADKLQDYYEDMLDPEMWAGQRGFKKVSVTARKNPRKKVVKDEVRDNMLIHIIESGIKLAQSYKAKGDYSNANAHLSYIQGVIDTSLKVGSINKSVALTYRTIIKGIVK